MKTEAKLTDNKYNFFLYQDTWKAGNNFDDDSKSHLICVAENICKNFDHFDEYAHIASIDNGASEALFSKLEIELYSGRVSDIYVELLVSALEMVHRCPGTFINVAVKSAGSERVLQLPCKLIDKYVHFPNPQYHAHAPTIISIVIKLFLHFTKSSNIKLKMAADKDIILSMVYVIKSDMEDWVKIEAINLLAELSYSKDLKDSNIVVIHTEGLLDALVECANSYNADIKEGIARTFLNLGTNIENRKFLACKDGTINILLSFLSEENSKNTKNYAIGALGNICACEENKVRLVNYEEGDLVKKLLFLISSERNKKFHKDVVGVLANLSNADIAPSLCNQPTFLKCLICQATDSVNEESQKNAMKVLRRLSSFVDASKLGHGLLLKALLTTLKGGKSNVKYAVSILKDQASQPINRDSLVNFPGLLDYLGLISLEFQDVKSTAIKVLLYLSYLDNETTFIANENVLNALVTAAGLTTKKNSVSRYAAMKTIKRLAIKEENRKVLANNDALLTSLKWAFGKETKIVALADTLTEVLTATSDGTVVALLDIIDKDKSKKVSDEDLVALAQATMLIISGKSQISEKN